MNKECRIIYFKSMAFQFISVMIVLIIFAVYDTIRRGLALERILLPLLMLLGIAILFFALSFFYFGKLRIIVDEDFFAHKMPDKTRKIFYKKIYKIEKILGWGVFGYYIFYRNDKGRKGTVSIPDELENYREVIDYISKKSGVQVKMGL